MDVPGWGFIALLVLFVFSIPGTFLTVNTAEVRLSRGLASFFALPNRD